MRTTTLRRPGARWAAALAAAAGLVMAFFAASFPARADTPPELAGLTADPASGLWADGAMGPTIVGDFSWSADWGDSIRLVSLAEPGDYTMPTSDFHEFGSALRFMGDPPTFFVNPQTLAGLDSGLGGPGSYEIAAFSSDVAQTVWTPQASAWLTYDDQGWEITAEEPAAALTTVSLRTEVDGEAGDTVAVGEELDVIATTTPAEAAGTVEVFAEDPNDADDEPVSLGTAAASNGSATVTVDDLEAGEYALTATFRPQDPESFKEATTTTVIPLTVEAPDAVQTTTTLAVTPESPAEIGAEVTLTATVAPAEAVGQVQFRVDGEPFQDPVDLTDGTATLTTTELIEGDLELRAAFLPEDSQAFTTSTSAPVTYTVGEGDPGPQVTAVDAEGNALGENPVLEAGQVVTLTAPGFQAEEEVTVTLDATSEAPEELGTTPADEEGTATTEFTAANLTPGQHALDFAGAEQTLTWQFQLADDAGDEDGGGEDGGDEDGGDEDGGTDGGTDDGTAGGAGGTGGNPNPSGSLAQTGAFLVAPAVLAGLAAVSAGYAFIRRSRRDELLTFDDTTAA